MTKSQAQNLWKNTLTDIEKDTPDIVYKLLQYNNIHGIFCPNPWSNRLPFFDEAIDNLPAKFINDPQALGSIIRNIQFQRVSLGCTKFSY